MSGLDRVGVALRLMKNAGARFQSARQIVRDARKHPQDVHFVRAMVRTARNINHRAVASARAAREWVQP